MESPKLLEGDIWDGTSVRPPPFKPCQICGSRGVIRFLSLDPPGWRFLCPGDLADYWGYPRDYFGYPRDYFGYPRPSKGRRYA